MMRVLVSCRQMQVVYPHFADEFSSRGLQVDLPDVTQQLLAPDLIPIIEQYHGVIAGDDEFSADVLAAGKNLKIISKWGVGVDGIDRSAADRLGIKVTNTPRVFDGEVADVCVGYIVLLARKLHVIDAGVRAGEWPKPAGTSLAGKTLAIVGLGGIGRALGLRARAMGMRVIGYEVDSRSIASAAEMGVEVLPLEAALREAHFVSLNCPLTPETRHVLNAGTLSMLPRGAFIVNTGRGPLIDESALVEALDAEHIGGAALDVFEEEPLPATSRLRTISNVILGSHNASNTEEAVMRVSAMAVDNLFEGLQ